MVQDEKKGSPSMEERINKNATAEGVFPRNCKNENRKQSCFHYNRVVHMAKEFPKKLEKMKYWECGKRGHRERDYHEEKREQQWDKVSRVERMSGVELVGK